MTGPKATAIAADPMEHAANTPATIGDLLALVERIEAIEGREARTPFQIALDERTWTRIYRLVDVGTHGATAEQVVETLIAQSLVSLMGTAGFRDLLLPT